MIEILAYPKLNLCIDILKKETNGYHKMQTVFFELKKDPDKLKIYELKHGDNMSITQSHQKHLPKKENNLAFRALKLVKKKFKIKKNAHIDLEKNIPLSSGLGGASSDAAAVLKGLSQLWNLRLSNEELMALGAELGMDVPFFIHGGTALGTNFGEKITPLKDVSGIEFEIFPESTWPKNFDGDNKTEQAYSLIDIKECGKNKSKTTKLLQAIEGEDSEEILKNLHNDFSQLYQIPENTYLSGSGPALFTAKLLPSKQFNS